MKKLGIKFLSLILIFVVLFTFFQMYFIKNEVYARSAQYTQYIKSGINAFPESYQKKLAYLKYLHPNWEFKAYYTGIDWEELVSTENENLEMKNTIHKGNLLDPKGLCRCGTQGDSGYYDASNLMVRYYIDPRNFLGEAMVFQFLDLSSGTGITRDVVLSATRGTYLEKYTDSILKAASEAQINPLHIVATIYQELGRGTSGTPKAISGTVSGYEGYYNFYNYGATDGAGAVERGLAKARELGWNNPEYALVDGAKRVLASGYISAGQTTKYFYKFDVVGNEILTEAMGSRTYSSDKFYGHQYMTNVRDPASQAGSLYDIYADNGILDAKLTFLIPVYNNMPAANSVPTSLTWNDGTLYFINSMKKAGVSLRSGPGTGYASYGSVYKDTIVAYQATSGAWTKVKLYGTTNFNGSTRQWNSVEYNGWVLTEYLAIVGSDVPDYRNQVDMGNGGNSGNVTGKAEFKVDGNYFKMTPATTVKNIKTTYSNAVIKNSSGTVINDENHLIATGDVVTVNGKNYSCIKYGDVDGDGKAKSTDYVQIKNYIMSNYTSDFPDLKKMAADVNKDGKVMATDYVQIKNYIMDGIEISI